MKLAPQRRCGTGEDYRVEKWMKHMMKIELQGSDKYEP